MSNEPSLLQCCDVVWYEVARFGSLLHLQQQMHTFFLPEAIHANRQIVKSLLPHAVRVFGGEEV